MDTERVHQQPPPHRLSHLGGCGWFWAWAVAGAVLAVGLDILPLLVVGGLLALFVGWLQSGARHIEGMLTGAGLPFLYVAYVNRQGPGTVCYADGHGGGGCSEYLNPWPWLVIGTVLVISGIVIYVRTQRLVTKNG
jgi:hypothetical protein